MGKQIAIWGGVFAATFVLLFFLIKASAKPAEEKIIPELATVSATDHVRGNPASGVVLVEFGDFQCPGCAAFEPMIADLSKEFGDKMVVVFRNFPLPMHSHAVLAAQYAEAADLQGKYWEMHDKLFAQQTSWATGDAEKLFSQYANELGLNMSKLNVDRESKAVSDRIENDRNAGLGYGVNSTPTFYLNGKLIEPRSYDQFKSFIQQAIDGNTSTSPTP